MNTRTILRTLAALALLGLLLGGLAALAWFDNEANRGITFAPDPAPIPYADGPLIGVNAYNIQFEADHTKVVRTLEMARDMGARYVRMQLPWDDVEIAAKGDFVDRRNGAARDAWEKYDLLFAELRRLGLEPIVRIDRPPDWARAKAIATPEWQAIFALNGNSSGPPDRYADYADFVAAVAARYRGEVRYIQIWNEPNLKDEWNGQEPSPAQFLDMLRQAGRAARAANPDAVIIFPSLAPTDGLDSRAPLTDLEYLDAIYQLGGAADFDIMSAQAYGLGQPPDEHRYVFARGGGNWNWRQPIDTRIDVSRLPLLREVMERNGDAHKAIWISEFGYTAAPASIPAERRFGWGPPVSEQQKGEYLVGQIERARREWPWVGVMNVWILRWGGPDPSADDPTPYFALVDRDFQPLPAYTAIQRYLAQPAVAGVGAHTLAHPAAARQGDRVTFSFEGTSLALTGVGAASVSIDGGAASQVTLADQPTTVAQHLTNTTHTAVITGAAPAALIVAREHAGWVWAAGAGALLVALAALGAAIPRIIFLSARLE